MPALGILALVFFVFAFALASSQLMKSITGSMGSAPIVGPVIKAILSPVAQAIDWACGQLVSGLDAMMGAVWHLLEQTLGDLWKVFEMQALGILQLAQLFSNAVYNVSGLHALVKALSYVAHKALSLVNHLERELKGIEAGIKTIEIELGKGIGNDVRTSVDHLLKWEKLAKSQIKADEKAITQTIPAEITKLQDFIKALPGTKYLDWVAGIVAAALGLASLGGFLCNEFKNILGRGCSGLWGGIDSLLALFIDTLILTDLCAILPEAVKFFGIVEGALTGLISQAANAVCASASDKWTNPNVAPGPLPPVQSFDSTTLAAGG